jgi:pyruvate dehydrogenase E2 component (dihydrolipoamide acetyltransferase)
MSWKIGMPNLGHTMEEGTVSQWLKAVGDVVRKGEVIAVVESDKASFDIESPADGTLIAIQAHAGAVVPVGDAIGLVGAVGEAVTTEAAPGATRPPAKEPSTVSAAPVAVAPASPQARAKISPAARALAETLGVALADVVGTGEDDLITRDDVRAHAVAPAAPAAGAAVALSPMRRAIAEATEHAWRTIPHVPLQSHADVTALLEKNGPGLTAAIARSCALALTQHPAFNGWLIDQHFKPSQHVNLAIAMSTPLGLITAVVPAAETQSVAQLAAEISGLAASARAGQLDGAKMTGGSFTISSLGRWGIDAFSPIISAPQVAILGVGSVNRVAREGSAGSVRFASEVSLTLVFDHRANDGLEAAKLLASIIQFLEHPAQMEVTS